MQMAKNPDGNGWLERLCEGEKGSFVNSKCFNHPIDRRGRIGRKTEDTHTIQLKGGANDFKP